MGVRERESKIRVQKIVVCLIILLFRFWQFLTMELIWHNWQSSIRPCIKVYLFYFVKSRSNPFLELKPVLSNENKVSGSRKQREHLKGLKLTSYKSDALPIAPCRPYNVTLNVHFFWMLYLNQDQLSKREKHKCCPLARFYYSTSVLYKTYHCVALEVYGCISHRYDYASEHLHL